MNFLDTYDIPDAGTPPPQNEINLNEEVNQVLGQLSSFWSWGKRQSQAAYETAKKDLTDAVSQAQKEVSKLTEGPKPAEGEDEPSPDEQQPEIVERADTEQGPSASSTTQTLFSRLQSALPPNVVSAVQQNIPESLKHAGDNIDLAQLRTTLSNEFQRVQGITRTQAEEYMHKSETLLREVVKEAGDALSNAVKVIPPDDESASGANAGLLWDGTDMWMLPDPPGAITSQSGGKGKGKASVQHAVATRAEALLKRLKHEPGILRHDPEADEAVRTVYGEWLASELAIGEGASTSPRWSTKITAITDDSPDGQAIQSSLSTLVPSEMDSDTFWRRYFFRVHQIEQEEAKRKALIQGSITNEEDFSWDDEDEDAPSSVARTAAPELKTTTSTNTIQPPEKTDESRPSANASPRESSEESYDLVSRDGDKKKSQDEDGDSDWE